MHDSFYLVVGSTWIWMLVAASAIAGAGASLVLDRARRWGPARRMLAAASILPALLALGSLLGWLASSPGRDGWENLVDAVWLTIALGGGGLAFVGGLAGALLIERLRA